MGQPYDELLYSLIISQLKDDGFIEEADSLQRKVVSNNKNVIFFASFLSILFYHLLLCVNNNENVFPLLPFCREYW